MAGKIKLDDKQAVVSAELGVDYAGHLKDAQAEAARVHSTDGRVKRTLNSLGMSDSRPLKDSDHKTLAAHKNADALIKDFEKAGSEIATAHFAFRNKLTEVDHEETEATKELFAQAAGKVDAKIKDIKMQMETLEKELGTLEKTKKVYIKQIDAAVEPAAKKFRKDFGVITDEINKLGARYSKNVWDFDQTRKYMKKK